MYRLNAALMVGLALAVIASAAFLADESASSSERDSARADRLLRKLADPDPDVRREGEDGLRAMGPRAEAALRGAARSHDRALAGRAARLLRERLPAPPRETQAPPPPAPRAVPAPQAPEGEEPVRFLIECAGRTLRNGEAALFYVRLRNDGPLALLLARDRVLKYARFAWFEVTDEKGRTFEVAAEPVPPAGEGAEVVPVRPGETLDLYAGQGDGRTALAARFPEAGSYQVRFVYGAGGNAYREAVAGRTEGVPLSAARLASNAVALQVLE